MALNALDTINFVKVGTINRSEAFKDRDDLINRNGNPVEASYRGKKYVLPNTQNELYTLGERVGRALKAIFMVLATLGFILDENSCLNQYIINCTESHPLFWSLADFATNDGQKSRGNMDALISNIASSIVARDRSLIALLLDHGAQTTEALGLAHSDFQDVANEINNCYDAIIKSVLEAI